MSEMRIRLRSPGEEVPKEEEHYVLQSMEEVMETKEKFTAEKISHMKDFQDAKNSFTYLRHLKMQHNLSGDEPCPVCHEPMSKGSDIMITPCGHMYCYFCIQRIFERFTSDRISCPICKQQVVKSEMFHVRERKPSASRAAGGAALARADESSGAAVAPAAGAAAAAAPASAAAVPTPSASPTAAAAPASASAGPQGASATSAQMRPSQEEVAVKGDFGTKVDALIMLLKKIALSDRKAKTIVFSQWAGVLQIVAVGLTTNDIQFADAFSKGGRKQDKSIQTFKASSAVNVLLLATKSGANGLNLTEATNVVLVEPVMSPAVEAQAVSRVLRIGQTQETHVWRLIVKGTIEEQILQMQRRRIPGNSGSAATSDSASLSNSPRRGRRGMDDELTVADLRSLFQAGGTAGATGSSAARSIDLAGNEAETAEALAQDAAFWRAQVAYNTRQVSREDAAAAIATLAAVERRALGPEASADQPTIAVFGRPMELPAAGRLLALSSRTLEPAAVVERTVRTPMTWQLFSVLTRRLSRRSGSWKKCSRGSGRELQHQHQLHRQRWQTTHDSGSK